MRALADGSINNVVLTFHVDSVAQEPNETFNLTLNPVVQPTSREGLYIFFRNTIQVIIVDSDSKDNFCIDITCSDYIIIMQVIHSQVW